MSLLEMGGLEVDAEAQGGLVQASLDLQAFKALDMCCGDAEELLSSWPGAPFPCTSIACCPDDLQIMVADIGPFYRTEIVQR